MRAMSTGTNILYPIVCVVAMSSPTGAAAQRLAYTHSEVAEGVHMFQSPEVGAGNAVAIISDGDAVLVDATMSPSAAQGIVRSLDSLGVRNVRMLVNTHWHVDHFLGNQVFRQRYGNIPIAAHPTTLEDMTDYAIPDLGAQIEAIEARLSRDDSQLSRGLNAAGDSLDPDGIERVRERNELFREILSDFRKVEPTLPDFLLGDRLIIRLEDLDVHVMPAGPGHTRGDVVIYVPARNVLVAGDLLTRPFPAVSAGYSYIKDWSESLENLASWDFETIIPGHGEFLDGRDYFDAVRSLFSLVLSHVRSGISAGQTVSQIQERLDVSQFTDRYVGTGRTAATAFARFFLNPAVAIAFREESNRNE